MAAVLNAERLTINQSARRIGCHASTIWRWVLEGVGGRKLPSIRVGGRRFVLADDLEDFVQRDGTDQPVCNTNRAARAEAELAARGV